MDPLDYYGLLKLEDAPGIIGYFCPANSAQPMYCCAGYYCSEDTKTITLCPQNYYCPTGTVGKGISCLWLASCPAGSKSASKFGLIVFVVVLLIGICFVYWLHKKFEDVRTRHLEKRLRWIHNHNVHFDNIQDDEQRQQETEDKDGDDDDDTVEGGRRPVIKKDASNPDIQTMDPYRSPSELTDKESIIQIGDEEIIGSSSSDSSDKTVVQGKDCDRIAHTFDIEFEQLSLTLSNGTSVLKNVSGILRSGRTCAIMGPSGSGKTTLISMLTSKIAKDEGRILVNGQQEDLSHYRKLIGFVPQEDIMLRELTVHDVLLHSAYMRLPSDMKRTDMTEKVLEIIDFLGLSTVMDSVIGDAEQRGISGGQRKRVNIGLELASDPSILFLDEPTSGLDSSTSGDICKLLKSIAHRKGLTVTAVIHSPSPVAFDQFDDLLLLGHNGRVVFHGPRTEAPAYFAAIGFPVPEDSSPSDFFMDVISNNVKSKISKKFKPFHLSRYWESYCRRAQCFYADGDSGIDYRHPSPHATAMNTPHLTPRASRLLSYPNLNQSAMSIQQNGSEAPESLAITDISIPVSSSTANTPNEGVNGDLSSSGSSSTLQPPALGNRYSRHKSVTMSREFLQQRSLHSSPRPSMAFSDFTSMYSTPPPPENLTFWETLQRSYRIFKVEFRMYWKDVFAETYETVAGLLLSRRDPIRNTANPFMMFWHCLNRARLQIYRSQRQFLYDQLLHLGCGLFISIAANRLDYLGRQPEMICAMTPYQLRINCVNPSDHLTEVGIFISLGVCFAGISVGSMTFGNEKIVYWRDKSSGLLTFPYYLAKVIADIPRIVLAGVMFSISLIIFFNERSNYFYLLFVIVMLYAIAFSMGYLLSALVPQNRVSLVGTGFTLAWAIVFSGDAPDLADVMADDAPMGYSAMRWIWVISAPRYAIEAIYLREIQARPWEEIRNATLSHTYELGEFWWCIRSMAAILFGWHALAFFSFKLKNRSKQR
ncbi:hypothetical protein BG011_006907 [Mortierella polycephala]|uniref:ABC transporter domain-containing protein n=1 Tax=Mortierella polycephala TaxID=41804 RepID=A0A9P6PRL9_9FUNG|nr:hypothetical protein BG011_006907 [Mortierella polycephala]